MIRRWLRHLRRRSKWHHLAMAKDGSTVRTWVDGHLEDVRYYPQPLTASEIQTEYVRTAVAGNPVSYWPLRERP